MRQFVKSHDFFIGIDSDGCVFDTMEVKHKECFIPNIIKFYHLAAISKYAREVAEFLNLYSKWRGINRFPGLVMLMDMLAERLEVVRRHPRLPALLGLRTWIAEETRLANPALAARVKATGDADLELALRWSEAVNRSISEIVVEVPPFPLVRESLESMARKGRRDGGLGDPARGARTGMVRAWRCASTCRSWPAKSLGASENTWRLPPVGATFPKGC